MAAIRYELVENYMLAPVPHVEIVLTKRRSISSLNKKMMLYALTIFTNIRRLVVDALKLLPI